MRCREKKRGMDWGERLGVPAWLVLIASPQGNPHILSLRHKGLCWMSFLWCLALGVFISLKAAPCPLVFTQWHSVEPSLCLFERLLLIDLKENDILLSDIHNRLNDMENYISGIEEIIVMEYG